MWRWTPKDVLQNLPERAILELSSPDLHKANTSRQTSRLFLPTQTCRDGLLRMLLNRDRFCAYECTWDALPMGEPWSGRDDHPNP